MFALIIVHNFLNRKWWRGLLTGKYSLARTIRTVIVFLVFIGISTNGKRDHHVTLCLCLSSNKQPDDFGQNCASGRRILEPLMCMHLGFHGSMLVGIAKKAAHESSHIRVFALRIAALSVSVYGIYAFIQRDFGSYMLLKNQFAFFDFNEPLILFYVDYIAIAALFTCVGHYTLKGAVQLSRNRERHKDA